MPEPALQKKLSNHCAELKSCVLCKEMIGPVVAPPPVLTKVYLIGQAPGPHEGKFGKPFAWTAGKTLFRWFAPLGVDEEQFRALVYMAAVCRCFPGKAKPNANGKAGGDRVPAPDEVEKCSQWMRREVEILKPDLVIPVGRLAIERVLPKAPLAEIIGKTHRITLFGHEADAIPLPHPSGASTWFKMEPGKSLLAEALKKIGRHPAWTSQFK
jgi:uracil-DNA glycosylase